MGDGAKNAVGPQLNNIIGRTIGSVDGFKYSDGFVALNDEGKAWTVEALDAWLTKPRDYIAGTKMAFGGLRKEDDRKNVIAYMAEEGQ
jgi:cytochrome c